MKNRWAAILGILTVALFTLTAANGQENGQENTQAEVTSGVARISLIHGDVSTQRGDSGDWTAAALNQPIMTGDKVSSGVGSRAELQLDQANILRLGDNTLSTVANLSRNQIQVQVARGLVDYTVFKGTEAEVEIDTANVAIHPAQQKDGVYRIEVNSEGETQVIVRKGEADISTPQGSTRVNAGNMIVVRGTADQAQYREEEAPSKDSWDSWNSDRDHTIRDAASWSRTNRYYVGSEDLDANGRWETVPDYGPVWAPGVSAGWAPYRAGRWVWEPGWGWTWVSYEPWGWAPYHYGRWFMYNSAWVWWPGPVVGYPAYRPVWAPAYVSFFGFGGGVGVGVGFGFGSVGWLPIGPCDRFYPWYGRYGGRFNSVNVVNITNVTNIHNGYRGIAPLRAGSAYSNLRLASVDERVRMGVSSVAADRFGTGRQTPGVVSREEFNRGRVMAGNLPVVPTRESLSVSNRPAAADTIQRGNQSQRFFTKSQPPAPQSFVRQQAQVQQAIERNGQFKAINAGAGRGTTNVPRPTLNSGGESHGVSTPGASTPGAQSAVRGSNSTESQGWRRFGSSPGGSSANGPNNGGFNAGQNRGATQNSRSYQGPSLGSRSPQAGSSVRPSSSGNGSDGGWRHFTPQSGGATQESHGVSDSGGMSRGSGVGSLRGSSQESPRSYGRPPLEMRQPIVTPRASEVSGGSPRGGYSGPSHSGGGYGGGGGGHSQPPAGGGHGGPGGGGGSGPSHSGNSGHRR